MEDPLLWKRGDKSNQVQRSCAVLRCAVLCSVLSLASSWSQRARDNWGEDISGTRRKQRRFGLDFPIPLT
jgi:hypothetical protein